MWSTIWIGTRRDLYIGPRKTLRSAKICQDDLLTACMLTPRFAGSRPHHLLESCCLFSIDKHTATHSLPLLLTEMSGIPCIIHPYGHITDPLSRLSVSNEVNTDVCVMSGRPLGLCLDAAAIHNVWSALVPFCVRDIADSTTTVSVKANQQTDVKGTKAGTQSQTHKRTTQHERQQHPDTNQTADQAPSQATSSSSPKHNITLQNEPLLRNKKLKEAKRHSALHSANEPCKFTHTHTHIYIYTNTNCNAHSLTPALSIHDEGSTTADTPSHPLLVISPDRRQFRNPPTH